MARPSLKPAGWACVWEPALDVGAYTIRATLTSDLNRYNDRGFKEDQTEIARVLQSINVPPGE